MGQEGKPHGKGLYTFRNGKSTLDTYENGQEVKSEEYTTEKAGDLVQAARMAAAKAQKISTKSRELGESIITLPQAESLRRASTAAHLAKFLPS
jgi:DNA mismatch repair protein MutH